ncbi:MAG: adenosylhomocysteinase, partial [Desulfurococcaceae archaeon]
MEFKVKDLGLAETGELRISWAERNMPVLMSIRQKYGGSGLLKNVRIGAVLHVTKETAVLVLALKEAGAEVVLAASNPLSTQDEVAAALVTKGISVFAWKGQTVDDYYWCIRRVAESEPDIVIDDGGDLHAILHDKYTGL